jgi:hypothetical protein
VSSPALHVFASSVVRISYDSNTHNKDQSSKIPPGNVLIHAEDMTQKGTLEELKAACRWISKLSHQVKVVIAGKPYSTALQSSHKIDNLWIGNYEPSLDKHHTNFSQEALNLFTSEMARSHGLSYLCK